MGMDTVSLGIETFNTKILRRIGKPTSKEINLHAINVLRNMIEFINIDLMFTLPGENLQDIQKDVTTAIELDVDEITVYPLFRFNYTKLGRKTSGISPDIFETRKRFYLIDELCTKYGYERCGVWSFIHKNRNYKFSSVTRHYYKGFGPSSGTMDGKYFYLNTFSVKEYSKMLEKSKLPIALCMKITKKFEMLYWLYWRLYETIIKEDDFYKVFGEKFDTYFGYLKFLLKLLNLGEYNNGTIKLNRRGSFWIHRVQNLFILEWIDKVWGKCLNEAWPEKIQLL